MAQMAGWLGRKRVVAGVAAVTSLAILGSALAQTGVADLPAGVKRVLDCRSVQPDAARLACYDAAVTELGKLISTGQVVSVDQEQVTKVRRQAFGFRLPSLDIFPKGSGAAKAPEIDQVSGVVALARQNGEGKWIIRLEDGAVWTQIDSEKLVRYPKTGSKVEIRKAALGTFFMNIDGQRALRVERTK
jgi:hypothetical protein